MDIETIKWGEKLLCQIIRANVEPKETTFLTDTSSNLQVGFVVYPAGGRITPHVHLPVERHTVGTVEVLIVKKGECEIDIYNNEREFVGTRSLKIGDVLLMASGGHGFRMRQDTVLLEVKQGPYTGLGEKERF